MKKTSLKPKNAKEFDDYFEDNDISDLLDTQTKRINIDLPSSIFNKLNLKARQLGMTRQALLKYWLADRLGLVNSSS